MYTPNGWWFLSSGGSYPLVFMVAVPRAQLATAWSTTDTSCTVCGHPTMSNYFTPTNIYKIVAVLAFRLSLLLFKRLQIGSTHVLFVATFFFLCLKYTN